jgi:hypothetical protein
MFRCPISVVGAVLGLTVACGGPFPGNGNVPPGNNCPPSPGPVLFQDALCVCHDLNTVGQSVATQRPSATGTAANVGVNGYVLGAGDVFVDGSFTGYRGLNGLGLMTVKDNLTTTGDARGLGSLNAGGDVDVGGDLVSVGQITVGGTLRVAGQELLVGAGNVAAVGPYTAPQGPPCPCDPATLFDVPGAVAAAQNNGATVLDLDSIGATQITLTAGSYYAPHVTTIGATRFVVNGAVALYLDGTLIDIGAEAFKLTAGSTLDLYISGGIAQVGFLDLGSFATPGSFRLYVGGPGAIQLVGAEFVSGMVYAPTSPLLFAGDTVVHGALFADTVDGAGRLAIHYDSVAAPGGGVCNPGGGSDAGSGTGADAGVTLN